MNHSQVYDDLCLSAYTDLKSLSRFVDSEASLHCIAHREWFVNYVQGDVGHETIGIGRNARLLVRGQFSWSYRMERIVSTKGETHTGVEKESYIY